MLIKSLFVLASSALLCGCAAGSMATPVPPSDFDALVERLMRENSVEGMAVAMIDQGRIEHIRAYGHRNAKGDPLTIQSIMYGASLTKTMFAFMVAQLATEGRIDLDRSIADYLSKPLSEYNDAEDAYAPWHHLAGDDRWRALTPRILLNHGSGFHNFYWLEPDQRLKFHFAPGTRYSYSGDGIILLQFVLEQGLGIDLQSEMQRRVFTPFGMQRSSLIWRPDFAVELADGWTAEGKAIGHDERSSVRAAGSLDTTIEDMARFVAGVMDGPEDLRKELFRPQLAIGSATQFPALQPEVPFEDRNSTLSAGLGTVTFNGPQGRGFFKGGHNDWTGNMLVCLEATRRCVVMLGNDVRAERIFPQVTSLALGETGLPWNWEYGETLRPGR